MKKYFLSEERRKMNFTKYICPVCEEAFKENDDVVVCPECGTPHHRSCWAENGKCFNEEKHGLEEAVEIKTAEAYEATEEPIEKEVLNDEIQKPENEVQGVIQEIIEEINGKKTDEYFIGNSPASYFDAAIGKNQQYYIPRFMLIEKMKKGISWNGTAFFSPLAWTVYRKMYKLAALIFALYMLLFGATAYSLLSNEEFVNAYTQCMQEDSSSATEVLMYISGSSDVTLTPAQAELLDAITNIKNPVILDILWYVVVYGTRLALGLFATNLYYKKLKKNISDISHSCMDIQMQKTYLFKKYGTVSLIIAAIIGIFECGMIF